VFLDVNVFYISLYLFTNKHRQGICLCTCMQGNQRKDKPISAEEVTATEWLSAYSRGVVKAIENMSKGEYVVVPYLVRSKIYLYLTFTKCAEQHSWLLRCFVLFPIAFWHADMQIGTHVHAACFASKRVYTNKYSLMYENGLIATFPRHTVQNLDFVLFWCSILQYLLS
jgi:hypothetical protein